MYRQRYLQSITEEHLEKLGWKNSNVLFQIIMKDVLKNRTKKNGIIYKLDIDFIPENLVLSSFFVQLRLENYPDFINDIANSHSSGYEFVSIRFFNDIDCDDQSWVKSMEGRELEDGEVFVYSEEIGSCILLETIFDDVLRSYSLKLIDVYATDNNLQETYKKHYQKYNGNHPFFIKNPIWERAMQYSLSKLLKKSNHSN